MNRKKNLKLAMHISCIIGMVLTACFLCGCAAGKPCLLKKDPRLAKARSRRPKGIAYTTAVAPVQIERTASPKDKNNWIPSIDTRLLQREIALALKETPVFADVKVASTDDCESSRRGGCELLLRVKLAGLSSSFGGTNGYFIPNIAVWAVLSPVASAFVADEFFNIQCRVLVSLVDTFSNKAVWSRSFSLKERFELNDWQRGPSVWDFFFLGPFLDTWTPAKVDSVTVPHLVRRIQVEVASGILEELPPPELNMAVVAGVDSSGIDKAPNLKYAEKDARDMVGVLKKSGYKTVEILTGDKGSRSEIEKILKNIAERSDVRIKKFLFYFSGAGMGDSILVKGDSIEYGRLPLGELFTLIGEIPSENKAVVIDAGFGSNGGKSFRSGGISSTDLKIPSGMSILLSSAADETSYESEKLENGVFTSYLLRALSGSADLDRNGTITADEVIRSVSLPVSRFVKGSLGERQNPHLVGSTGGKSSFVELDN